MDFFGVFFDGLRQFKVTAAAAAAEYRFASSEGVSGAVHLKN
jgi:hypothetical protein